MRLEFRYGTMVWSDNCHWDNIYSIDIKEEDEIIELNDYSGFVIGWIMYKESEQIECVPYNENDEIDDEYTPTIVLNGKVVIKNSNWRK